MRTYLLLAGVCTVALAPAYGQLYLIQGSPTPKYNERYPTALLRVGPDGAVQFASVILPGGPMGGAVGGLEWIGTSYDHRRAVLLTKPPGHAILALDFDTASVTKSCEAPPAPAGMSAFPFEEWLADIPGKGLTYVEHYGTADMGKLERGQLSPGDYALRGMLADASTPCDQSFVSVVPSDVKSIVLDGAAGFGASVAKRASIGKDGTPTVSWFGGERTYLDYRLPDDVMTNIAQPNASALVNNGKIFAAFVSDPTKGQWKLSVLRKSDSTWHTVPGIGTSGPFVSGFGSFVALTETEPKTARNPESAGQSEWPKAARATGSSLGGRISNLPYVLPGKLDLYDVATEKTYTIVTNQGDSEILLVDDNTVYYRVSNRLYSATIGPDGLEPAKLLSTSDALRDVHWAFVKH